MIRKTEGKHIENLEITYNTKYFIRKIKTFISYESYLTYEIEINSSKFPIMNLLSALLHIREYYEHMFFIGIYSIYQCDVTLSD